VVSRARAGRNRGNGTEIDNIAEGETFNDDNDELLLEEKFKLARIPRGLCSRVCGIPHYAHQECIARLKSAEDPNGSCPRCQHAKNVIHYRIPHGADQKYCQAVNGGFTSSSKLTALVNHITSKIPADEKCVIFSGFKGGLDLLEGIFHYDCENIVCARFDGDVDRQTKDEELERFKNDPECNVLLASIVSAGVGLNIVEANHVLFLDRWFNPFVHDQASDRCHRIGQTRDVEVVYFDCALTVDEAMKAINQKKKENSTILLADALEIGQSNQSLGYKDLSGLMGKMLSAVREHRTGWIESDPNNMHRAGERIPPMPLDVVDAITGMLSTTGSPDEVGPESTGLEDFIVNDSDVEAEFDHEAAEDEYDDV